jgi:phosphate-selective porin OprO/OprP
VKQRIAYGAALAMGLVACNAAQADSAKTLGGIVVTSDDGNFIASLGGRIHFDYTGIMPQKGSTFDAGAAENDSGFYFRRVFISLSGKIYGWRYRIDEDISNTSNPGAGFQDVYASHDLGNFGTVRIGQTRAWHSMDCLMSNNDKIFTERNVLSENGLFGGRDYTDGVFYRYNRSNAFKTDDNFWGGVSVYSLGKAGATTDQGVGTPTQGMGYNARLAYAPIFRPREFLHIGGSFSSDHADNGAKLTAGYSTWYSYKGVAQNIISMAGTQPASTPTQNNIQGGNNPNAETVTAELAGELGPWYIQGEFGQAKLHQPNYSATNPNQQTADAFSVQTSYYLTGESKVYDPGMAALGASPRPLHPYGAVEVALRYDFIRNRDLPAKDTTVCAPAVGAIPKGSTITKCDISTLDAGVNYYVNPNVRFMLDYYYGTFDLGSAGKDRPKAVNARFQIAF